LLFCRNDYITRKNIAMMDLASCALDKTTSLRVFLFPSSTFRSEFEEIDIFVGEPLFLCWDFIFCSFSFGCINEGVSIFSNIGKEAIGVDGAPSIKVGCLEICCNRGESRV
jgi:hypothetical protein